MKTKLANLKNGDVFRWYLFGQPSVHVYCIKYRVRGGYFYILNMDTGKQMAGFHGKKTVLKIRKP